MTVARAGAGSSRRSDGVATLGRRRGAAESERLNGHVTATEPGRAKGWELEQHSLREMCWGGKGGSPGSVWVGCQVRCGKDLEAGHGRGGSERNKHLAGKGKMKTLARETQLVAPCDLTFLFSHLTTRPRLAFIFGSNHQHAFLSTACPTSRTVPFRPEAGREFSQ